MASKIQERKHIVMGKKLLDRAKLAAILNATRTPNPHEVASAMARANHLLDEAGLEWADVIPGARVRVAVRDAPPSFVEAVEMTIDEAINVLLLSSDKDRVALGVSLRQARREGNTITGAGARIAHRYANEEMRNRPRPASQWEPE